MSFPRLVRLCVGWLLIVVGVLLVPVCWIAAGILHARACGSGFFLCGEPLLDSIAHTLLISLSPQLALVFLAVGDDLANRR